jgi:hypothetical protein
METKFCNLEDLENCIKSVTNNHFEYFSPLDNKPSFQAAKKEDDDFFQMKPSRSSCFEMEHIAEDPVIEAQDEYWSEHPQSQSESVQDTVMSKQSSPSVIKIQIPPKKKISKRKLKLDKRE